MTIREIIAWGWKNDRLAPIGIMLGFFILGTLWIAVGGDI